MKHLKLTSFLFIFCFFSLYAQRDWDNVPIAPNPGSGNVWQLQEAPSDDFNYTFNASNTRVNFGPPGQAAKWYNTYHDQPNGAPNTFQGPGPTIWTPNQISVQGGFLNIIASRVPGEVKRGFNGELLYDFSTRSGCMTNLNRVKYPVFIEARIQIMNSMLASDIWLLSPDDTEEIDIIEAYGGTGDDGRNQFFAERIHLSHHVFIRQPFTDYQPRDFNSFWRRQGVTQWGGQTVNIGVYWVSPTRLEYYIDGQLQRIVDNNALQSRLINGQFEATYPAGVTSDQPGGQLLFETGARAGFQQMVTAPTLQAAQAASNISVIDPFNHLNNGRQFSRDMDIIINVEDQSFQADAGRSPSDTEISRRADHTMRVDWIRVYKPVSSNGGNPPVNTTNRNRSLTFNNSPSFVSAGNPLPQFTAGQTATLNLSYATGITNGNEEDLNYVAVQVRELDENGNEVATSPFTVAIPGDSANTGTTNFSYTIPTSFDEAGNNPIPSSSDLDPGHQILLLVFMSVDNDSGFADDNTPISFNTTSNNNPTPIGNQPPQISFSNPLNGANFTTGSNIGVTVNANDIDGNISNVRLFFDGSFIRQENIAPYNWGADNGTSNDTLLNNLTAGPHTLQAVATDNNGAVTSQSITINVNNTTPPPSGPRANVALNKTATQSSTLFGLTANFAIDGNTNNFSHSDENGNTWLEIDLEGRFNLDQVNIWNRQDCCAERLSDYQLFISDQPFTSTDIVTTANQPNVGVFFQSDIAERPTSVGVNIVGRYVRIQLIGVGFLNIAEIEVFGTPIAGAKLLANEISNSLILYPNPVSQGNTITIENTLVTDIISILDFTGKSIITTTAKNGQSAIDLSNISSGLYFVKINNKTKKLIID